MSRFFLRENASRARLREAAAAQANRRDIVKALSWGQVSRRDLLKLGVFTGAGLLAPIRGLSPFASSAFAASDSNIPTGMPPSPLGGVRAFSQPLLRFDVLPHVPRLTPEPTLESNQTLQPVHDGLGGGQGPIEGRPPGPTWAHQGFSRFPPKVFVEVTQEGAKVNASYDPGCDATHNSGVAGGTPCPPCFHPALPIQDDRAVWTFNGSVPPKLLIGRYGEPILFRHHNRLPVDLRRNRGFGRHTISTHEHNGHHGAENDGFTGAFFFPGQFYDYHYPILLAGVNSVNTSATDPRASAPDDDGHLTLVPGDWRETMSTHWFHDHMFSYTSQNVYKGNAGMFNIYSGLDRGAEDIIDGVNLRLPSGRADVTGKSWANLDYDVNLMLADKAWDRDGQLAFDIFDFDGFLGDVMTVNLTYKPFFEVEPRKYRFRILNASVSRFFKLALSDGSPIIQIGNDGNLLPAPVVLTELDEQGIAERFDIVIDFSRYQYGDKVWMVNLCEHDDGKGPKQNLSLAAALSGRSDDPCVGRFLEFRVVRELKQADLSQVPATLIPNPDLSNIPVARERVFEFGRGGKQTTFNDVTSFGGPWGIKTGGGDMLNADFGRISAAPKLGTREVWTLKNGGGGWDHPIHIHFEEGQVLARNGSAANVPPWERGRKDVYRLRPGGSVTITMQFRDFAGTYMEHCHNTVHEDNSMLLRWDVNPDGETVLTALQTPIPTPQGVTFIDPDDELPGARSGGGR
ncbi:MAG TPA: multicopper oxidase domain-containing protein [Vicinamibacterales bacterium]|nr:multicopper oxidase domain-containing protein [Vicinamibacterales bacterium]